MSSKFQIFFVIVILSLFAHFSDQKNLETDTSPTTATCDEECICHPPVESGKVQYVVGYGSFIRASSIKRTDPDAGEPIPVIVEGYQRVWNAQGVNIGFSTTYLGIEQKENSSFNGVIFPLASPGENKTDSDVVKSYDLRETWYCRHKIVKDKVKFLDGNSHPEGEYWIYVNKPEFTFRPNKKYPIVQSYVDTFITGCMEIEEKFSLPGYTSACIKSTEGWNKYWVNDRIFPRRPNANEPRATAIDKILFEEVPNAFKEIKIEG